MKKRTSVEFSETVEPLFKKYSNIYGVKNICSLGVILIDQLDTPLREDFIGMVAADMDYPSISLHVMKMEARRINLLVEQEIIKRRRNRNKTKEKKP